MDARQRRIYERGQRVDVYMGAAAGDFPVGSKGGTLAADIKEILAEIAVFDVARSAGASTRQQGTAGRGKSRADLRRMVASIADTAKSIALDRPEVEGIFSLAAKDGSDQTLITTARAFADAAGPLAALFTEYGLTPAFFDDMRDRASALDSSISLQNAGSGARRQSKETMGEALQRLNGLIDRLDTVVRNKYRGNPDKLAAWEAARRIESPPHSNGGNNNAPPPPAGK